MSNLYPGDEVNPQEAGRLLNEQAAHLTARRAGKTTAQEQALDDSLRRTSDEGLLTAFAALTHRLHVADRKQGPDAEFLAANLRLQRGYVQVEILRRMQR